MPGQRGQLDSTKLTLINKGRNETMPVQGCPNIRRVVQC